MADRNGDLTDDQRAALDRLERQMRGEQAEQDPRFIAYSDPVKAAMATLKRHLWPAPEYVVRQVVDAVLAAADTIVEVRREMVREAWAVEDFRRHERALMRRQLLAEVGDTGRIPTALPAEELRYFMWPSSGAPDGAPTGEVPAEAVAAGIEWRWVELCLWVPVRTPPVDRRRAVESGLL